MKQIDGAKKLISQLVAQGVSDFVVCAGARNAPLVKVLATVSGPRVFSFFDERAAAFFALGRIRASARPVAVVTTSGTAVAELLPATVEAWYSCLPLVLVTADRPPEYRGTGAPQAIEQVGIFSHYVAQAFDFVGQQIPDFSVSGSAPTHLNISFDEPLVDAEVSAWTCPLEANPPAPRASAPLDDGPKAIADFAKAVRHPLVVVGELTATERALVKTSLLKLRLPVLLEAPSGLREDQELAAWRLEAGEGVFQNSSFLELFDGVIRVGGVPTTRLWRDLEKRRPWAVLNFSERPFSGLSRCPERPLPLTALTLWTSARGQQTDVVPLSWRDFDQRLARELAALLDQDHHAEPSVFRDLSRQIPHDSNLFLGSSLPIREWDLAAPYQPTTARPRANRGANGIDGVISTFIGSVQEHRENWLILGDLSALYDLNAPWALRYCGDAPVRIVVINNQGGKIFRRLFNDPSFENQHRLGFEALAEMWGLDYYLWRRVPEVLPTLARHTLIEIRPNEAATTQFWDQYATLCQGSSCSL